MTKARTTVIKPKTIMIRMDMDLSPLWPLKISMTMEIPYFKMTLYET